MNSSDSSISQASANDLAKGRNTWRALLDCSVATALLCALLSVHGYDSSRPKKSVPEPIATPAAPEPEPEPPPPEPQVIDVKETLPPIDRERRIVVRHSSNCRFGVSTTTGNPDDPRDDYKKLTFSVDGSTCNTRVWIDGATPIFGGREGKTTSHLREDADGRLVSIWENRGVQVTQIVEYVGGDISRRTDTVQVTYRLKNISNSMHEVGLRMMLDSLIGDNDGVPFIVPGSERIVTSPQTFRGDAVPDFVRALENGDLVNPGVIVDLGLKRSDTERPEEIVLTHWPGGEAAWEYDGTRSFGRDTAIGIYYKRSDLSPGAERVVAFTYGLGSISSTKSKNAKISLTAGGPFRSGGKFWLVALVQNPQSGHKVKLDLPEGFKFDSAHTATKSVTSDAGYAQLSWLIEIAAEKFGPTEIKATLEPDGAEEKYPIAVQPRDARLTIVAKEPVRSGKTFWVSTLVQHAKPGQTVEIQLADGVKLAKGHEATKPVPQKEGYAQINWLVEVPVRVTGATSVTVRLLPDGITETTNVKIQAASLID